MTELARAIEDCRSTLLFLQHEREATRRALIQADYATKSKILPVSLQAQFDRVLVRLLGGDIVTSDELAAIGDEVSDLGQIDVGVLCVNEVEWRATRRAFGLSDDPVAVIENRRYYASTVAGKRAGRDLKIGIAALTRTKNMNVAKVVKVFESVFSPESWFLIGIAAGVQHRIERGHLVVPSGVVYYQPGTTRADGSVARRPETPAVPEASTNAFFYYDPDEAGFAASVRDALRTVDAASLPKKFVIDDFVPTIQSRDRLILSGDMLVRDRFEGLKSLGYLDDPRVVALDMESYGFSQSAPEGRWTVVRGISDYGENNPDPGWQVVAATTAAVGLVDFLTAEYLPPSGA